MCIRGFIILCQSRDKTPNSSLTQTPNQTKQATCEKQFSLRITFYFLSIYFMLWIVDILFKLILFLICCIILHSKYFKLHFKCMKWSIHYYRSGRVCIFGAVLDWDESEDVRPRPPELLSLFLQLFRLWRECLLTTNNCDELPLKYHTLLLLPWVVIKHHMVYFRWVFGELLLPWYQSMRNKNGHKSQEWSRLFVHSVSVMSRWL